MPESIKPSDDLEILARSKPRVLVVDDAEPIADITAAMLTAEGYFVEATTNGAAAFDLYCDYLSQGMPFDFVLTGLAQPGMNGIDLIQAILEKNPRQSFGYSTASPVLPVPFERSQLLAFVKQRGHSGRDQ